MSVVGCSGMFAFSIILEIINNLVLIKRLANRGYRYDNFKVLDFRIFLLSLIPIINIILTLRKTFLLNLNNSFVSKNIIPMTKVEKKLYSNNPSIGNAIKLNKSNNLTPNMVLVYTEKEEENIIYFMNEDEKYIITSVKGPVSVMSRKNQYRALKNQLNQIKRVIDSNNNLSNIDFSKTYQKKELASYSVTSKQEFIDEKPKVYTKYYSK